MPMENENLGRCYNRIRQILGPDTEPYESVALVETYRQYWKPARVNVVLLAESHVYTAHSDRNIRVPILPNLPQYPTEYAKFVYCLAYGEKQLTGSQLHPRRDGTPQFWKIFFSCNHIITTTGDFSPVLFSTNFAKRINNKINLLTSLKQRGVWLVDSSIVALYDRGVKNRKWKSVIKESWDSYTGEIVRAAKPNHIIMIGRGVSSVLESDVKALVGSRYSVIAQPNAHLSSAVHLSNYRRYSEICLGYPIQE
jgi:hypothetical protein